MIPKTISPTELRNNLYGVVRDVASHGGRYLITPSEGDSVVLCAREEYNALVVERQLLRDLREAEADVVAGRLHTTAAVRTMLAHKRPREDVKGPAHASHKARGRRSA
jgi:PHD/YefM family antitoxin component YafN of YafNO toxin-antitoxin module